MRRSQTVQASEIKAFRLARENPEEQKDQILDLEPESEDFHPRKFIPARKNFQDEIDLQSNSEKEVSPFPHNLLTENNNGRHRQINFDSLSFKTQEESDSSTPPKITHVSSSKFEFENTDSKIPKVSFYSDHNRSNGFDSERSLDEGNPAIPHDSGFHPKRLGLGLGLESLSSSDSLLQNADITPDRSLVNSPLNTGKVSARSNFVYRKSQFFKNPKDDGKDSTDLGDHKPSSEGVDIGNESNFDDGAKRRPSKLPLTVIPVVQRLTDNRIESKQPEIMVKLKKEIKSRKRLMGLYEIIKTKGKALKNTELYQKSKVFC